MLKKANDLLYSSYYQEAIQEYDQIISTKPDKDIILAAFYNQAQAYDGIGQYSSSAANYQKIIDIDPQFRKG
jgi:tetratricopeptide (TPR) repeat protein